LLEHVRAHLLRDAVLSRARRRMSVYAYAKCSCGWNEDASAEHPAAELIAAHVCSCQHPMRAIQVPMWSVAWPYYWATEEAKAKGEERPPFGLEMDWRPVGTHSTGDPSESLMGWHAKMWWLLPEKGK